MRRRCLRDTALMPGSTIIAVVGAESTGKSVLAEALAESLAIAGLDVVVVPERLRAFCAARGRTPRVDEQTALAHAQSRRIRLAAERHAVVIADTTALMTAVYSDLVFDDTSLYDASLLQHRACRLTLVTGLDLPWVADGIQRDGPQAQHRVDARLRSVLQQQRLPFSVVYGVGRARVDAALAVVWRCLRPPAPEPDEPRWRWVCRHCGDGACEAASAALPR
jgi:nicotinamide riboside kinase